MNTLTVASRRPRRSARAGFGLAAGLAAAILGGTLAARCSPPGTTSPLTAAFDDGRRVGSTTAVWERTGDERGFAGGARLAEPEIRFRYRVDVTNRTDDKVFVRLSDVALTTDNGLPLVTDSVRRECVLGPGDTPGVLTGEIWVPKGKVDTVAGLNLSRFAAPLGERDLPPYRAWLLQGRPGNEAAVNTEIAAQAAAPPCAGH